MILDISQIFLNMIIVLGLGVAFVDYLFVRHNIVLPRDLAPIFGLSLIGCIVTAFWFLKISMVFSYIVVLSTMFCLLSLTISCGGLNSFWRRRSKGYEQIIMCGFGLLIAAHGSLLPFSAKISQGFPWDRYTYVGAAIGFSDHPLNYYEEFGATLSRDGSNKQQLENHMNISLALNDMHRRPTVDLIFGLLNYNNKQSLHLLGNSYETLLRIIQFLSFAYLAKKLIKNEAKAIVVAGMFAFGYWMQYIKDFNAWGFQFATIFAVSSLGLIIDALKDQNHERSLGKMVGLMLLIVAACIGYPETGFILVAILCISILTVWMIDKKSRITAMHLIVAIILGVTISFIVYPYNYWYLKYLSTRLSGGLDMELERYVRSLINPYIWSPEARVAFLENPFSVDLKSGIRLFPSSVFGVLGLHMLGKFSLWITAPLSVVLFCNISYSIFRSRLNYSKEVVSVIVIYCALWLGLIILFWVTDRPFPALRSISYIFPLISCLIIIFLIDSDKLFSRVVAYVILSWYLAYGALVFQAQRDIEYHRFDVAGYALTHDVIRIDPFNNQGNLNDSHDLDYRPLQKDILQRCNAVYLDLGNYWHMAGLVFFLENNNLLYQTRLPYRDLLWGAGVRSQGKLFSKFFGNCRVYESISREGKIGYSLEVKSD